MSYPGLCRKRHIDKYTYLSSNVLGEGYSGTVYLGKQQPTGQQVAIKIIEKSILKLQAHKSMILCEIQFLTNLKGKDNIMMLYDVYNTKNNIYLVSQLCNTDLKDYLAARKKIPEPQAIQIIKNIIIGFRAIWQAKIVHRDLKPSNILIKGEQIKIADFGFSMYENQKEQYQKINVGSPLYMPIQVLGYNQYSYQSDIWAIGIIFYEMLTGKTPWKATSEKQLYNQMKNFDISQMLPKNICHHSKSFLLKTLVNKPQKRIKPEQFVQFQFEDLYKSIQLDQKSLLQSQQLRTTLKKAKTLVDPEQCLKHEQKKNKMEESNIHSLQLNKEQKQMVENNQSEDKNSSHQEQEIQISLLQEKADKINLAESRMKNERYKTQESPQKTVVPQQQLNSPTRKHRNVNRKKSLEVNYQPFQGDVKYENVQTQEQQVIIKVKQPTQKKTVQSKKQQQQRLSEEEVKKQMYQKMKVFSKVLRSQIHYCRFLFKLLKRIIECIPLQSGIIKEEMRKQMMGLIFQKLNRITQQKIDDPKVMKEWTETKQWDKIQKVVKQYKQKYQIALGESNSKKITYSPQIMSKQVRKSIIRLYKRAYQAYVAEQQKNLSNNRQSKTKVKRTESQYSTQAQQDKNKTQSDSQIMKIKEQIIILDYFITLKQLMKVEEKHGWEGFQKKAKIESIVEGEPLKYIQQKHILAISEKLENLKIL